MKMMRNGLGGRWRHGGADRGRSGLVVFGALRRSGDRGGVGRSLRGEGRWRRRRWKHLRDVTSVWRCVRGGDELQVGWQLGVMDSPSNGGLG